MSGTKRKPPSPHGHSKVYRPDIMRAQAKAMVARRLVNIPVEAIAKEFNTSTDTVKKRLDWARRNGLVEDGLDQVLNQLVPEAIKTFLLAIQGGDVDAARDVLFGTGVLQKNPTAGRTPVETVEMTIETWRASRALATQSEQPNEIIDATTLPPHEDSAGDEPALADPEHSTLPGNDHSFDPAFLTQVLGADSDEDDVALDAPASDDGEGPATS